MSYYFPNAQNFKIGDYANLSNVQGDQYNYNQIMTGEGSQRKRYITGTEEEEAHYAEYYDVRHGDIVIGQDLGLSVEEHFDREKMEWIPKCERKMFTAEIRGKAGKATSKYTVVSYHGPEKEEAWKKDFHQFSEALWVVDLSVLHLDHSKTHAGVQPMFKSLDTIVRKPLCYYYTTILYR